jgi:hypothetical protein
MTKSLKVLSLAAVASLLAAPCALAEKVTVTAAIPFDFVVADRQLPSGEYRFVTTADPGVVRVYSTKTQEYVATVPCRQLSSDPAEAKRLVFERHGSERFLKRIRSGDGSGVSLAETRSERQAEARASAEALAAARAQATGSSTTTTSMP